jgi:hypothetical protein
MPNLIWQYRHHWATLEMLRNVSASTKNEPITVVSFLTGQVLLANPINFLIAIAGLYFFMMMGNGRFRALGFTYIVTFAILVALGGKVYYLAPAYPMMVAAGAVAIEKLVEARSWRWLQPACATAMLVVGLVGAPLALPVLPVENLIHYSKFMGIEAPKTETRKLSSLPQHFADMFGWEEMTSAVAEVYNKLPPQERAQAAIYTQNYGEAAAIDFFGRRYGLPRAISGHQNYFLWGTNGYSGGAVIIVGGSRAESEASCGEVEMAATFENSPYAMPDESNLPIFVCRKPKLPINELWPKLKHWL